MKLDSAVLYSNDISKVTDFYQNIIGLELDYRQGDKYVSFKFSNGVKLGIKRAMKKREKPGAQTFIIGVDNVDRIYKGIKKKGVKIYKDLASENWGKVFSILDPDKNKVEFVQRK